MYDASIAYQIGAVVGSIIAGAIVGAIPAITGAVKGKIGLGIGGFFACIAGSLVLGLILSVPTCALFMFLIFKKNRNVSDNTVSMNENKDRYCKDCGNKLSEDTSFCPQCGAKK